MGWLVLVLFFVFSFSSFSTSYDADEGLAMFRKGKLLCKQVEFK